MRKGFNDINSTFKVISREKETQYLYLQKILELVETGILSYEVESGDVVWMNDSLKKILGIPYLKIPAFPGKKGCLSFQGNQPAATRCRKNYFHFERQWHRKGPGFGHGFSDGQ